MPYEPLSEDNTSCEEEVIKQRYKKNIIVKEINNISLNNQIKKSENNQIKKPENNQIKKPENNRPIRIINNNALLLLRK